MNVTGSNTQTPGKLRTNCWDSRVTNTISSNASKVEMRFTPGTKYGAQAKSSPIDVKF
jgi:hypothetical protein